MRHPEFDLAIRYILDEQPTISEFDLIKRLKSSPYHFFSEYDTSNQHQLFQVHFILFNALFELQSALPANQYLLINSVRIELLTCTEEEALNPSLHEPDAKLKAYYLDLNNLKQTTQSDVEELLDSFWRRYYKEGWDQESEEATVEALKYFEIDGQLTTQVLRKAFRKKCHDCHPDKGGNHEHFVELKRHYELLSRRL